MHIDAVTFDFFGTLVRHRAGSGRSRRLKQYFEIVGLPKPRWDERSIYRVLERHSVEYSPGSSNADRRRYLNQLALRVFVEAGAHVPEEEAALHADALWEVLGPPAFEVFPDALPTLRSLRRRGVGLAVISNWHSGLAHYIADLGLGSYFDAVIGSTDTGFVKPDRRTFDAARQAMGSPSGSILHVGDSHTDDYMGALSAGWQAALLSRDGVVPPRCERVFSTLTAVPDYAAP